MKLTSKEEVQQLVNIVRNKITKSYLGKAGCGCGCRGTYNERQAIIQKRLDKALQNLNWFTSSKYGISYNEFSDEFCLAFEAEDQFIWFYWPKK